MIRPIIVFDLDGTLVDSRPDLLDCLNLCLASIGLEPADPEAMRGFVGHGGRVMLARASAAQGRMLDEDELNRLVRLFLEHYSANMPGKTTLFPGTLEALDRFSDAGFLLAICTNKYEHLSTRLIDSLGIADRFAAICGADTFAHRKPDPRHLTDTIAMAGGDPRRAIMVGDSRTDIDTARAAAIPVVAVDWGYSEEPVSQLEPTLVISHYDALTVPVGLRLIEAGRVAPAGG